MPAGLRKRDDVLTQAVQPREVGRVMCWNIGFISMTFSCFLQSSESEGPRQRQQESLLVCLIRSLRNRQIKEKAALAGTEIYRTGGRIPKLGEVPEKLEDDATPRFEDIPPFARSQPHISHIRKDNHMTARD